MAALEDSTNVVQRVEKYLLVYLSLQWSESNFKKRFSTELERRLQTWFHTHTDCHLLCVKDKTAFIKLTPAPDESVLKELVGQTLEDKDKDNTGITVVSYHFPDPSEDKEETSAPKEEWNGQQHHSHVGHQTDDKHRAEERAYSIVTCDLPFRIYQYILEQDVDRIEKRNSVKISADVKVTFKAASIDGNPAQALDEFITLAQRCLRENKCSTVDLEKNSIEVKELLPILKKNVRFDLCGNSLSVCGPSREWDKFANVYSGARDDKPKQGSDINIRDPLVDGGLDMEETIWKQIQKEVNDLKTSFGVEFRESAFSRGKVNVKVLNQRGRNMATQSHATRALLRLYQKRATACSQLFHGPMSSADVLTASNGTHVPPVAAAESDPEDGCPICLDSITNKTQLKCKHSFCKQCIEQSIKSLGKTCPVCKFVFGRMEGDQPDGNMTEDINNRLFIPGFNTTAIVINYYIPDGIQTKRHPNPGSKYHGLSRQAYLPNNKEGRKVLKLLRRAFDQKLIFTVGTSRTTGQDNQVTWNDIHHKTRINGGPRNFGYPDPDYLMRVQQELKDRGISD